MPWLSRTSSRRVPGIDVAVEHLAEQRLHLGPGEGLELDPADRPILAETHDRVGQRLAGAGGEQEGCGLGARQLVEERGGRGVEELRVIDGDHHPPAPALLAQPPHAVPEDVEGAHRESLREQRRERAEGDGRRRQGGGDLSDQPAVATEPGQGLGPEPGLADPGGTRDDHPARGRTLQLSGEQGQLLVPTDKRPGRPAGGGWHGC